MIIITKKNKKQFFFISLSLTLMVEKDFFSHIIRNYMATTGLHASKIVCVFFVVDVIKVE